MCTKRTLTATLPAACLPCPARCGYAGGHNPSMRTPLIWTRQPQATDTGTLNTLATTTTLNTVITILTGPSSGLGVAWGV